jgi:uncharacterized membrane protein YdjX (TVP38/TMEM64 family)
MPATATPAPMPDGPAPPPRPRPLAPRLLVAAVVLGAVAAFLALGGPAALQGLAGEREALRAAAERNRGVAMLVAAVVYAAATALSLPVGVWLTLACGFLFGRWVGTAVVVVAASTGAALAFLAARYVLADALRARLGPRLAAVARGFGENGFSYLLFLRLVPVFPFWLVNVAPALTPIRLRTFWAATVIGIVPGTFVFANLGVSLARIEEPRDLVGGRTLAALGMLGALSLLPVVVKRLRIRRTADG